MSKQIPEPRRMARNWLAASGVGLAAAWFASWSWKRIQQRKKSAARRMRSATVPLSQARQEADWTRRAVSYAGGAKGG